MDRIAVAILNWNGLKYLQQFLPSVVENSPDAEVWIIDNGSDDDSLAWVRASQPSVLIHENGKNLGFAQGYNAGLKYIEADYFVLLNSDVEVTPNWIQPVISTMKQHAFVACQPKIMDFNQKERFEYAGAAGGYMDKDGFAFCAGRIFYQFEEDLGQYDSSREVFWASGAALFIEADKWREIGGLDTDFFAHMEEIDLCWRLKNRGYSIGYCPDAQVYHVGGGTLHQINPFKTYLNFRNNLYLLTKNHFESSLASKLLKRLVLDGIAGMRFLTEGNVKYTWSVIKAHFSFYGSLGKMLAKRKEIKAHLHSPNLKGMYGRSILVDFFFRGKKRFEQLEKDQFIH
ncbi:MAG: glycosyltransferase family 2 protein [Flavobacteriales bacterium]|nr:glycosyltransferase family 2 protein [Flavobacteriales bacterium]